MDLYLGSPIEYVNFHSNGYALAHEMKNYRTIRRYADTRDLILDNGADELGVGQKGSRLAYLAGALQPNFIILPDVLHDERKTRKSGIEFYNSIKDSGYTGKFMAVIQAKTIEKGLKSYKFWASTGIVDRIGITYDTKIETPWVDEPWGNRLGFLYDLVLDDIYEDNPIPFHLLGTLEVQELWQLFRNPKYRDIVPWIASHDTTAPWACDTEFRLNNNGAFFGRPKNWDRLDFNKKFNKTELNVRHWNIAVYLTACKVPRSEWDRFMSKPVADDFYLRVEETGAFEY